MAGKTNALHSTGSRKLAGASPALSPKGDPCHQHMLPKRRRVGNDTPIPVQSDRSKAFTEIKPQSKDLQFTG